MSTPAPPESPVPAAAPAGRGSLVRVAAGLGAAVAIAAGLALAWVAGHDSGPVATSSAAPAPSAVASASPSVTPADTPSGVEFGYQPLWPFASPAAAKAWQQDPPSGQSWRLDPALTAVRFASRYLGYQEIDKATSRRFAGDEAWIGVGMVNPRGQDNAAAVLHLSRIGTGTDRPWEVVGSRDTDLSLTTPRYGSAVTSPLTAGGRITGVDESLWVQVVALAGTTPDPRVAGRTGGVPAGGRNRPWSIRVAFDPGAYRVLTVAVSTGGHLFDVERFAITGVRVAS